MGVPNRDNPVAQEILRQASVALGGRPVVLWEAVTPDRFQPRASSDPRDAGSVANVDLTTTVDRWKIPIAPASWWLGSRAWPEGPWIVAPVRSRPPAPPPGGRERRSRERITLELAGLCLGLGRRLERPDPLTELAGLPAMIAHEASNPLAAAKAGLQLAMEAMGQWRDVDAARRLQTLEELGLVVDDIDRATTFLRAIQDRARGAFERIERFDAMRVILSCLTLEQPVLRQRGLDVRLEAPFESLYLKGDPNDLFDLLVNLLRNAADAAEGRPDPIEVRLTSDGDTVRLEVRDSGAGIAPEHLDRIFEPGFTTKEFGKGSGMGLAVVRRAVAAFGGEVTVESEPGRGTRFTVSLPVPPQRQ